VFLAGASTGIVEDVVETIRGIYHLVGNLDELDEMIDAAIELIGAFFSSEGQQVAYEVGNEIGRSYAQQIIGLLHGNDFEFAYNLGRLIGPTIVLTVLAPLIPGLIAPKVVGGLMKLRPLLQRFPRLRRVAEAVARRLPRRHGPDVDPDIERRVEHSFSGEQTFTEPDPQPSPRQTVPVVPELAAQFTAAQVLGFRRLKARLRP
jgi:hypothetical protein